MPDYVTRVQEGGFYGWPWYYLGDHEDPRLRASARSQGKGDCARHAAAGAFGTLADDLLRWQRLSICLSGRRFVAVHGSWNRSQRTGYKVIRVLLKDGVPTGEYEDFLTGFVTDDTHVWGRPVGVAVAKDGSLLVSEDANGMIWRISYRGEHH